MLLNVTEWTTEGCETDLAEVDEGVVTCNCNHLTNFAILVVSIPSVCVCVCVCKSELPMGSIAAHQISVCLAFTTACFE